MDDLVKRLRANGLDECDEAIDRIEELEAQVRAADALAVAIERRMVDLGGFDNRFGLRKAMENYYRATKEGGA